MVKSFSPLAATAVHVPNGPPNAGVASSCLGNACSERYRCAPPMMHEKVCVPWPDSRAPPWCCQPSPLIRAASFSDVASAAANCYELLRTVLAALRALRPLSCSSFARVEIHREGFSSIASNAFLLMLRSPVKESLRCLRYTTITLLVDQTDQSVAILPLVSRYGPLTQSWAVGQ